MGNRRAATLMMVLVAGLVAPIVASGADPGLVGWWKFDGDGLDASGNNRNGTAMGDAHFEPGYAGQALAFDGNADYFTVTGWKGLMSTSPVTVTAWVRTTGNGVISYWGRNASGRRVEFRIEAGRLRVEHGGGYLLGNTPVNDGEWHHAAVTIPANAPVSYPQVKLYLDGEDDTQNTQDPGIFNVATNANNVDVSFGYRSPTADQRYFTGILDDVRIYDRVLDGIEIRDMVELGYLANAHTPSPADGSTHNDVWVKLEWTPGPLAASHNVYFGTSIEDVNAGVPGALLGSTTGSNQVVGLAGYPLPEGLVPGATYYWRVEEVGTAHADSPWHGQVWSFFVPPMSAYDPWPVDGMQYVSSSPTLRWKPGVGGLLHYVSLGAEPAALRDGLPQTGTTYVPAEPLESGKTYYWRVDEFNAANNVTTAGTVWSFTTVPTIPPVADPTLLGWWKMDEVNAGTAVDWSGHALHGTISGTPQWIDGVAGAAVSLDGFTDYFATPVPVGVNTNTVTLTAWINPARVHTGISGIIFSRGTLTNGLNLRATNQLAYHWNSDAATYNFDTTLIVPMNEWSFVAVVVEPEKATLYLDGSQIKTENVLAHPPMPFDTAINLGQDPYPQGGRFFGGALDDLRFYTRSLTGAEIDQVMAAGVKPAPTPEDPAMIESFDSYNAYEAQTGKDVWDVWSDGYGGNGTGSTAGNPTYPIMERAIVVGNRGQSLPFVYNNTGSFLDINFNPVTATISEVSRTFSPALDLTQGGATKLVLYVRGNASNTVNTLLPTDNAYLTLTDGVKTDEVLLLASADLTGTAWKEVSIDLSTLTVDPAKVTRITLGVGNRAAPQIGGTGTIYIDEITRK